MRRLFNPWVTVPEPDGASPDTNPKRRKRQLARNGGMRALMSRVRVRPITTVAFALAGIVLLFFLGRFVLSHGALLLDHVAERRTPLVELSLWAGADPNYRNGEGRSVLPVAVELGDFEITALLLDAGADPNSLARDGESVLVIAVKRADPSIVSLLLAWGAFPNTLAGDGASVLAKAVSYDSWPIVEQLLDAGAFPNSVAGDGRTVFASAVESGDPSIVQLLLDAGAYPNTLAGNGGSVLARAVEHGSAAIVEQLLDAGADSNSLAGDGGSVLARAVEHGNAEVMQALLDAGANPEGPGVRESAMQNETARASLESGASLAEALVDMFVVLGEAAGAVGAALLCIFSFFLACP